MTDTEHDVEIRPDGEGTWRWDCSDCEWTGISCPSADFAQREHERHAERERRG